MLKPADPGPDGPDPSEEKPIGELVHQLIEDGKAYARAEIGVAKAMAAARVAALKLPTILFGAAFVLLLAAIVALAYAVAAGLATLIGPFAGGLVAFLLFAAVGGGLAWLGLKKAREAL